MSDIYRTNSYITPEYLKEITKTARLGSEDHAVALCSIIKGAMRKLALQGFDKYGTFIDQKSPADQATYKIVAEHFRVEGYKVKFPGEYLLISWD